MEVIEIMEFKWVAIAVFILIGLSVIIPIVVAVFLKIVGKAKSKSLTEHVNKELKRIKEEGKQNKES